MVSRFPAHPRKAILLAIIIQNWKSSGKCGPKHSSLTLQKKIKMVWSWSVLWVSFQWVSFHLGAVTEKLKTWCKTLGLVPLVANMEKMTTPEGNLSFFSWMPGLEFHDWPSLWRDTVGRSRSRKQPEMERPFLFNYGSRNSSHRTVPLERQYRLGLFPLNTESFGLEHEERAFGWDK